MDGEPGGLKGVGLGGGYACAGEGCAFSEMRLFLKAACCGVDLVEARCPSQVDASASTSASFSCFMSRSASSEVKEPFPTFRPFFFGGGGGCGGRLC